MSNDKKQIVEAINASFTKNDTEEFLGHCTEDIVWTMAGEKTVTGKNNIREWMSSMEGHEPPAFTTDLLIAEGNGVVCSGNMTMKDADGVKNSYNYCDIYQFSGDKVSSLTSFVVKEKSEEESNAAHTG
ncbi:MAG: nuclear transport factor 2 family protein [Acidobacteria bacterium]|nr:nuclear transport factor 2 family protein [Acidobacteriota bacterium]